MSALNQLVKNEKHREIIKGVVIVVIALSVFFVLLNSFIGKP